MFLFGLLAIINDAFPECTITNNEGTRNYVFQSIKIPAGECMTTTYNAMLGTYGNESKYKVSYKTATIENDELKYSNEIQYEFQNPIFLNKDGSSMIYYKIQAVNPQEELVLYFSSINPTSRDEYTNQDSFIINSYSGSVTIVSDKDKEVNLAFILKHQEESVTIDSNVSISVQYGDINWGSSSHTLTSSNPQNFRMKFSQPTKSKVSYSTPSWNSIFDENQLPFYAGIVPLINGPIAYHIAKNAIFERDQALQDQEDASYYSECKYLSLIHI